MRTGATWILLFAAATQGGACTEAPVAPVLPVDVGTRSIVLVAELAEPTEIAAFAFDVERSDAIKRGVHFAFDTEVGAVLTSLEYSQRLEVFGLSEGPVSVLARSARCRAIPAPVSGYRALLHDEPRPSWAPLSESELMNGVLPDLGLDCLRCIDGRHDDGRGLCVATSTCASRKHDGGDGACVPVGDCSAHNHDGGDGSCIPSNTCLHGYHDGGDGACIVRGTCTDGHHDDGLGNCVPAGDCADSSFIDGDGGCTPIDPCPSPSHDGGGGSCVPRMQCAPSFTMDAKGVCYRFRSLPPLVTARFAHGAVLLDDGRVLIAGGDDGRGLGLASTELFDPRAEVWSEGPPLHHPRAGEELFRTPNGEVITVAGYNGNTFQSPPEVFVGGEWLELGDALHRYRQTSVQLRDGSQLIIGGSEEFMEAGVPTVAVERYDPWTRSWSKMPSLGVPRANPRASLLPDGRVLVSGGFRIDFSRLVETDVGAEIFDPRIGAWSYASPTRASRWFHAQIVLRDGRVLDAGGVGGGDNIRDCELYDGAWTNSGALSGNRAAHTLSLLRDGRVLAVGGTGVGSNLLTAEIFDPATGVWTLLSTGLINKHSYHTATVLEDGRILIAGALDDHGTALAAVEIFEYGR